MGTAARVLFLLSCSVLLVSAGCSSDADLAEATYSAQYEDARARVWIPINEPRSIGTYRAELEWGDGNSDRVEAERDGMISVVQLADLVNDSNPELIVATSSSGSGTYGSVHVYGRRDGEMAQVDLTLFHESQRGGYMGHDVFSVEDGVLWCSWPEYEEGDPNSAPSGGEVRFWYSFADNGWIRRYDSSDPGFGREDELDIAITYCVI